MQVRYQAALRPEAEKYISAPGGEEGTGPRSVSAAQQCGDFYEFATQERGVLGVERKLSISTRLADMLRPMRVQ